jgi:hypothetical protein
VGALTVLALASAMASLPPVRTVSCSETIGTVRFPYAGYRTVLGEVGVPGPYLTQVVATRERPWTHWRKAGLLVRAGSPPVTVSVARAWRDRAAITWGNDTGIVASLRIAGCPGSRSVGHAYAGGFYLRVRSACVPLTFRVGRRSATVRFGVGRRCVS